MALRSARVSCIIVRVPGVARAWWIGLSEYRGEENTAEERGFGSDRIEALTSSKTLRNRDRSRGNAPRRSLGVRADTEAAAARVSWSQTKRRGIRFVVLLGVLMVAFSVVFYLWLAQTGPFTRYLELNALASGGILNSLGNDVMVDGKSITSSRFSLQVQLGCEAGQVGAFLLFAIVLWPGRARWLHRGAGVVVGLLSLSVMNVVRIVSLYYTGVHFPRAFDTVHIEIWQPAFIALALFLWIAWIMWATEPEGVAGRGPQ